VSSNLRVFSERIANTKVKDVDSVLENQDPLTLTLSPSGRGKYVSSHTGGQR
jgi:hypothetical protein